MLDQTFGQVYTKFKLHFYKQIFSRFEDREATLTTVESFCMEVIMALGEPTIAQFSHMMNLSTPNAAYKINSLVKKGYVERIQSTTDKREYRLRPTQKYIDYYNISYSYLHLVMERAKQRFSPDDLAKLEEMTSRYCGIKGIYEKEDLDYPKRDLLVWCGIEEAAQAEKIMHAKWPVNVLAAETGAKAVALLVTSEEEADALEEGAALVQELVHEKGLELLGFGCLSNPDNEMVRTAMAGALLQAAAMKVPVMLDGVAVCKAAKKAADMAPAVLDYCFAGHVSAEPGAEECLQELGLTAPLRLNIPDGAGEGAAVCFTLFNAGIKAYKEMETFEEAGVHAEMKEFSLAEQSKKGAKA